MSEALDKVLDKSFDESKKNLDRMRETNDRMLRATDQRSAGLEQDARQPCFTMETDVTSGNRTRKRTKDAAADRVIGGNSSFAQINPNPMCLISFGNESTEPPAFPCCRNDPIVDKGAAASKSCISPVEMRTLKATRGLLPTGTASTATRTIFHQPPLWFCPTEGMNSRTSIQYATTYYSSFWKIKVLETKLRQTLVFDPGGSTARLRACSFLVGWCALLYGEVFIWAPDGTRGWSVLLIDGGLGLSFPREVQAIRFAVSIAVGRCSPRSQANTGSRQSPTARGYMSCGDKQMSGNAMERGA